MTVDKKAEAHLDSLALFPQATARFTSPRVASRRTQGLGPHSQNKNITITRKRCLYGQLGAILIRPLIQG